MYISVTHSVFFHGNTINMSLSEHALKGVTVQRYNLIDILKMNLLYSARSYNMIHTQDALVDY